MKFIHDKATISGNVKLGENTSVWPGAVIRGDLAPIKIGKDCSIQDNAVIHTNSSESVEIGNKTIIAHSTVLHSCKIGNNVLVGIKSIVLDGCIIGDNVLIAAGTLLKPMMEIPSNSFVYEKSGKLVINEIKQKHLELMETIRKDYSNLTKKYVAGEIR